MELFVEYFDKLAGRPWHENLDIIDGRGMWTGKEDFTVFRSELHFVVLRRVVLINKFGLPYRLPSDRYTRKDTPNDGPIKAETERQQAS